MQTHELQRRVSRYMAGTNAPGVAGFLTYGFSIPSPIQERSEAQWKIEDIIVAQGGGPVDAGGGAMLIATGGNPNFPGPGSPPLNQPGDALYTLSLLDSAFLETKGDFDVIAASDSAPPVSSLDFHPVFVNPHETLRLYLSTHFTGAAGPAFPVGYTLSYTLVTTR